MHKYQSIIKSTFPSMLISGIILYWGLVNYGYLRMLIGGIAVYISLTNGIQQYNYAKELDNWIQDNQGLLILFYPTKKTIQNLIKIDFIPRIAYNVEEVYYDGSNLVGGIKRSIIIELMKWNSAIRIHEPSMLKIKGQGVIVEKLSELMKIEKETINHQDLLERIEKIRNI